MAKKEERPLSRREARDLEVEIGFLEGLVRRDPQFTEALELLGDDYTLQGRHGECLQIDQRLRSLRPQDPNVRFNLACSLALAGQPQHACSELEEALELGYRDFRSLQRDPDLAEARKHPDFKRVRDKIRRMQQTSETE